MTPIPDADAELHFQSESAPYGESEDLHTPDISNHFLPPYAPVPSVTLSLGSLASPTGVLLGDDSFTFTATFNNTSGTGTDVGYGPFIDLIFPVNGADGAAGTDTPDGIDFVSATYLGLTLTSVELTFPDADGAGPGTTGCVDHPYAMDATNQPRQVCGTAGDKLVVVELPYGSFTVGQPPIDVTIEASLSNLADMNVPLPIRARGGFRFGADPLDNPCCDLVILLPDDDDSDTWGVVGGDVGYVEPTLISLEKIYSGPEDETATGPNFERTYTIRVDLAPDQEITNLVVTDNLPDNMSFIGLVSTSPAPYSSSLPISTPPPPPPGGSLVLNYDDPGDPSDSIVGNPDPAVAEVSVEFEFFIPQFDASASAVIDPATGIDVTSLNNASASADWTPVDVRDAPAPVTVDEIGPEHTLNDRSIAIQKGTEIAVDTGVSGFSPGDVLQYTYQFQISDYFAFEDIIITDRISDGQRFDGSFTPVLSVTEHTILPAGTTSGAFDEDNFTVTDHWTGAPSPTPPIDGTTTLEFRISDELVIRPGAGSGQLLGGCVPDGGTGGPDPDCSTFNGDATIGTLTYQTIIQQAFTDDFPSGDPSVDHGDVLDNAVTIAAIVLDNSDLSTDIPPVADDGDASSAGVTIERGGPTKSIYAVNGAACGDPCQVKPGDEVTFRLEYTLPSSDFENVTLTDYLPLPIFWVGDPDADRSAGPAWTFDATVSSDVPLSGVAKFGPDETLHTDGGGPRTYTPGISIDTAANSIEFDIGTYDSDGDEQSRVDILFTLTVTDEPFTDLLFLTNLVRAHEGSTNSDDQDVDGIIQLQITEPYLTITKGVIYTDHPSPPAAYTPSTTGPVTFLDPLNSPRWSGTIHSNGLANFPIDSDLSGVDGGALVTFAIVIENIGHSASGAFDIRIEDTIPDDFEIPSGGLNLQAYRGDGTPVPYLPLGPNSSAEDLFTNRDFSGLGVGNGIELVDPGVEGACAVYDPTSGANIVIVTYDLQLMSDVEPLSQHINTATITQYASTEGGPSFVDTNDDSLSDDATVTALAPTVAKSILWTNQTFTDPGDTQLGSGPPVAIGEIMQYQAVITVPEGISPNVVLTDTLDQGLAFVSLDSLTISDPASLTTDYPGGFNAVLADGQIQDVGGGDVNRSRRARFDFGTITNSDSDNATAETITLTYTVIVINSLGNDRGDLINNAARWSWVVDGSTLSRTGYAPNATIVEPWIIVTKEAIPDSGDAGDEITFRITVEHDVDPNNTEAYDLVLSDPVPAEMVYVGGSLDCTLGPQVPDSCAYNSGTGAIEAGWDSFTRAGGQAIFEFRATIRSGLAPGQVITNTANLTWTSLPGDVTIPQTANNPLSTERTGDTANPGGDANDYTTDGSVEVTVFSPGIGKVILGTNQSFTDPGDTQLGIGPPVAIGEQVQYRATITVPEATSVPGIFRDTLDEGMAFMSCDSILASAPLSADNGFDCALAAFNPEPSGSPDPEDQARTMVIDFGTVTNSNLDNTTPETIVITYTAVILNSLGNDNGDSLTNTATWEWGSAAVFMSAPAVTIAEADLIVTKLATPDTGDESDEITFTITIEHGPSSTADAFNLELTDDIVPTGMTFIDGSLDCTLGAQDPDTCLYDPATQVITAEWTSAGGFTQSGGIAEIEFRALLPSSVTPGQVFTNTARLTWTSLPGDVTSPQTVNNDLSVERTGDSTNPGGLANDYETEGSEDVTVPLQTLDKTVFDTSATHTGGLDVTIGEIVTYQITLSVPPGATMVDVRLVDVLDDGLAFRRCVQITAPNLTTSIGTFADACPTPPDITPPINPVVSNNGHVVDWDFGTISNTDLVNDSILTVQYEVVVLNTATNVSGVDLDNSVSLTWIGGAIDEEAPEVTIVEPTLTIGKSILNRIVLPNSAFSYTLTVDHAPGSETDAFDLRLTDAIPSRLAFVGGTLVCDLGVQDPDVCIYDALSRTVTAEWTDAGGFILFGGDSVVNFRVRVAWPPAGTRIRNEANLEWSSLPGDVFSVPQSIYNELSIERRYDPLSAVDVYFTSDSVVVQVAALPDTGFSPNRTTVLPSPPPGMFYSNLGGLMLEVPTINLLKPIVGVPMGQQGWDLTWLWDQAGYLSGTAFPTWLGNTAITGHVVLPNGLPGPFSQLSDLKWGDEIVLHAYGLEYIYQVREVQHVLPGDLSVLRHETYDWITLITCEAYDERSDRYLKRLAVRAVLVEVRQP